MDTKTYDQLITLPHHRSRTRLPMPQRNRAAQFAPFAALSGYEGVIYETERQTQPKPELAEDRKAELNDRLQQLAACPQTEAKITYFVPDRYKPGGAYRTVCGCVKKIDGLLHRLQLTDGTTLSIEAITEITGELWEI